MSDTEYTECAVCGYSPNPDRIPPHYVLSLSDEDVDDEYVQSYPFGGSLNVPFACSDECWLDAQDDPQLIADGGQVEDDPDQDLVSDLLSWAKQEKANARGRYHDEESGSFEQGIPLGRLHAMSDVIEFIYENRSTDTENEQDDFKE